MSAAAMAMSSNFLVYASRAQSPRSLTAVTISRTVASRSGEKAGVRARMASSFALSRVFWMMSIMSFLFVGDQFLPRGQIRL